MKGIDVTPEQLAHAEDFLLRIAHGSELRRGVVYYNTQALSLKRQDLIRLLAWFEAIRAKIIYGPTVKRGKFGESAVDEEIFAELTRPFVESPQTDAEKETEGGQ